MNQWEQTSSLSWANLQEVKEIPILMLVGASFKWASKQCLSSMTYNIVSELEHVH